MANGKTVSDSNLMQTLVNLWPYMWPTGRPDLKMRVVWAAIYLLVSKFVLLLVPYFFKWSTDALNGKMDLAGKVPRSVHRRDGAGHRLQSHPPGPAGAQPAARRAVCQRRPACGAPARLQDLRAHA
jgi:hypothetical protein